MGLFDSILGALAGGQSANGQSGHPDLVAAVVGLLAQGGGAGLSGLVQRFEEAGLGNLVSSWIGTGQNLPISPNQVEHALGPDALSQIAQQFGLTHGDAADQLSQMLPQLVDHLTPQGHLPEEGIGDIGAVLARFSQH